MPSKIVVDKQKSSRALISFGKANEQSIAQDAATLAAQAVMVTVDGTPVVIEAKTIASAIRILVLASCARVDTCCNAMALADEDHTREQGDDDEPRQNRDKTAAALYDGIVELRSVLGGVYTPEALVGLGFSRTTPQDPEQLLRFSKEILKTIADKQKDNTLPQARKGVSVELSFFLPAIEKNTQDLEQHLSKVSLEKRELETTLEQKNTTMGVYDLVFQATANLFEGLFRFVGRTELAGKLRPSPHKPGQLEEDPEPIGV
jgi:hypothetical protein